MAAVKILDQIYWVGAVDWQIRHFHGYTYNTQKGTTYNAYLILDEKIALVDTVYQPFTQELIENIKQLVPLEKIAYVIANHVETDHSGALPEVMRLCPQAQLVCNVRCKEGLQKHYYGDWNFALVKTGDKISLGKKTLTFIEAPMLHWPDSMFTYVVEEGLLLPNDAFGQHYATSERFDDEVDPCILMDEAAKYYANILLPFSPLVLKKIEEVTALNIPLNMIAPSHGIIWRKEPMKIVKAYLEWAKQEAKSKAVIVYETMWGATEKMARKMAEALTDSGISVKLFDVNRSDRTEIIKEIMVAKGILIGSPTQDNGMLPNMAGFLEFLKGLKPKNKIAAAFGSFGWSGEGVGEIEKTLAAAKIEVAQPALAVKYVPNQEELNQAYAFGKDFAQKLA
jgi:anaerobic nitric oxide reductase flavorubredoxin